MSGTGEATVPCGREAGATLLEMLVVVAILAMTAAIAFPMGATAYEHLSVVVAQSALAADLRTARSVAARTDAPVAVQVFDDGRRYRVGERDVLLPATLRLTSTPARIVFHPSGATEGAHLEVVSARAGKRTLEVVAGSGLVVYLP